jgi:hypothetical protein
MCSLFDELLQLLLHISSRSSTRVRPAVELAIDSLSPSKLLALALIRYSD